jgi:hypothetical protein
MSRFLTIGDLNVEGEMSEIELPISEISITARTDGGMEREREPNNSTNGFEISPLLPGSSLTR